MEDQYSSLEPQPSAKSRLSKRLSGLWAPEAALRRGQDLVSGVTQATKEELTRMVATEVRGFLEKINVVDLFQQVITGLTVDVSVRVKFSREGKTLQSQTTVTTEQDKVSLSQAAVNKLPSETSG